jgi:hypothetical protein
MLIPGEDEEGGEGEEKGRRRGEETYFTQFMLPKGGGEGGEREEGRQRNARGEEEGGKEENVLHPSSVTQGRRGRKG